MKLIAIALLLTLASGCGAPKAAARFSSKDVAKVYIDPRRCRVLKPGEKPGDLECTVRVLLGTVGVEDLKRE